MRSFFRRSFRPKYFLPSVARLVSFVYLFTNVAFAHSPQTSVWNERKNSYQVASIAGLAPLNTPFTQNRPALQTELLKQTPNVGSAFSQQRLPSKFKNQHGTQRLISHLPSDFFAHVNIKNVVDTGSAQTVVLLEDVHQNTEAQQHISQAILSFGQPPKDDNVLVALEGASGPFLFEKFKKLDSQSLVDVADSYLESKDISGPAHAGFVSAAQQTNNLLFWGVDDKQAYPLNIKAYQQASKIKPAVLEKWDNIETQLVEQKRHYFSGALANFDWRVESYRKGQLPLRGYVKALVPFNENSSLAFDMFVQALEMEEKLDFTSVETERRSVIEKLVQKLTETDLNHLLQLSLAYQQGTLTFAGYYTELKTICAKAGVDLHQTRHFDDYIRYVLLADSVDASSLFKELHTLEQKAYAQLTETPEQEEIVHAARSLYLTKQLVNFSLTTDEWVEYQLASKNNSSSIHALSGRYPSIKLSSFESFYRAADIRSRTIVKKTIAKTNSAQARMTVLVAGGFHTEELETLLRKQNISFIVASPKITKVDDPSGSAYLSVFDREKTPLDEIFSGQKLFVAPPVAGQAAGVGAGARGIGASLLISAVALTAFARGGLAAGEASVPGVVGAAVQEVNVKPGSSEVVLKTPGGLVAARVRDRRKNKKGNGGKAGILPLWKKLTGRGFGGVEVNLLKKRSVGPGTGQFISRAARALTRRGFMLLGALLLTAAPGPAQGPVGVTKNIIEDSPQDGFWVVVLFAILGIGAFWISETSKDDPAVLEQLRRLKTQLREIEEKIQNLGIYGLTDIDPLVSGVDKELTSMRINEGSSRRVIGKFDRRSKKLERIKQKIKKLKRKDSHARFPKMGLGLFIASVLGFSSSASAQSHASGEKAGLNLMTDIGLNPFDYLTLLGFVAGAIRGFYVIYTTERGIERWEEILLPFYLLISVGLSFRFVYSGEVSLQIGLVIFAFLFLGLNGFIYFTFDKNIPKGFLIPLFAALGFSSAAPAQTGGSFISTAAQSVGGASLMIALAIIGTLLIVARNFSPLRRPLIAFNWKEKMNSRAQLDTFFKELQELGIYAPGRDVAIMPSIQHLDRVTRRVGEFGIFTGAQNIDRDLDQIPGAKAATGSILASSIKDEGATYVILGHSERRSQEHETDEIINLKVKAALKAGLIPILCIGEKERNGHESGEEDTPAVLTRIRQLTVGLDGLTKEDIEKVVIAYEPVWAIGTGVTPTLEEIQSVHHWIRDTIATRFNQKPDAEKVRILYGGSANEKNAEAITALPDVDGLLVGGAGLKADTFKHVADAGVVYPVATTDMSAQEEISVLRGFLGRLKRLAAGAAIAIPLVVAISDQHGTQDKFDALILESIRQAVPEKNIPYFQLNPDQTLNDQLKEYGVTIEGLKGKLFFKNIGDLMDRGPHGIKVYKRSRELIEAGISDFVIGNHDLWMFLNIAAFHLPWYNGFKFYGYSDAFTEVLGDVGDLVFQHHESQRETKTPLWWAEKLAEYTKYHQAQQKNHWNNTVDITVNGEWDSDDVKTRKRTPGTGLYAKVKDSLTPEQDRLWGKLRGFYLVDVQTGVRSVGEVSVQWWVNLLREFLLVKDSLPTGTPELVIQAWGQAINLIKQDILPELDKENLRRLNAGDWWWRVFEAINYNNYTSVEWWGKDWVFHEGWGTSVLKELNKARKEGEAEVTPANYLTHHALNEIAEFFKNNFTLYTRDIYQNTYVHAMLPIDLDTGEFYFTYKGVNYRGLGHRGFTLGVSLLDGGDRLDGGAKPIWEGLDQIRKDVRDAKDLKDIHEALSLVNAWYADNTTIAKPRNVVAAVKKLGVEKILKANGVNRLFFGHIPLSDFMKKEAGNDGTINDYNMGNGIFFTDHGMGEKFGGRGAAVLVGANGVHKVGYGKDKSLAAEAPQIDVPTTDKDGNEIFKATPISKEVFLPRVIADVEARIAQLQAHIDTHHHGLGVQNVLIFLAVALGFSSLAPAQTGGSSLLASVATGTSTLGHSGLGWVMGVVLFGVIALVGMAIHQSRKPMVGLMPYIDDLGTLLDQLRPRGKVTIASPGSMDVLLLFPGSNYTDDGYSDPRKRPLFSFVPSLTRLQYQVKQYGVPSAVHFVPQSHAYPLSRQTGEWEQERAGLLREQGVEYVFIGQYADPTDYTTLNHQVKAAHGAGLTPILLIQPATQLDPKATIQNQIRLGLQDLNKDQIERTILAYKNEKSPLAYRKGENPFLEFTQDQLQTLNQELAAVRLSAAEMDSEVDLQKIRVLYAGTIPPKLAPTLAQIPASDGVIIFDRVMDLDTALWLVKELKNSNPGKGRRGFKKKNILGVLAFLGLSASAPAQTGSTSIMTAGVSSFGSSHFSPVLIIILVIGGLLVMWMQHNPSRTQYHFPSHPKIQRDHDSLIVQAKTSQKPGEHIWITNENRLTVIGDQLRDTQVGIAVPFVTTEMLQNTTRETGWEKDRAEVLKNNGATHVLIGTVRDENGTFEKYSELRAQIAAAFEADLKPILFLGSGARNQTLHLSVLDNQISDGLAEFTKTQIESIIFAYDPFGISFQELTHGQIMKIVRSYVYRTNHDVSEDNLHVIGVKTRAKSSNGDGILYFKRPSLSNNTRPVPEPRADRPDTHGTEGYHGASFWPLLFTLGAATLSATPAPAQTGALLLSTTVGSVTSGSPSIYTTFFALGGLLIIGFLFIVFLVLKAAPRDNERREKIAFAVNRAMNEHGCDINLDSPENKLALSKLGDEVVLWGTNADQESTMYTFQWDETQEVYVLHDQVKESDHPSYEHAAATQAPGLPLILVASLGLIFGNAASAQTPATSSVVNDVVATDPVAMGIKMSVLLAFLFAAVYTQAKLITSERVNGQKFLKVFNISLLYPIGLWIAGVVPFWIALSVLFFLFTGIGALTLWATKTESHGSTRQIGSYGRGPAWGRIHTVAVLFLISLTAIAYFLGAASYLIPLPGLLFIVVWYIGILRLDTGALQKLTTYFSSRAKSLVLFGMMAISVLTTGGSASAQGPVASGDMAQGSTMDSSVKSTDFIYSIPVVILMALALAMGAFLVWKMIREVTNIVGPSQDQDSATERRDPSRENLDEGVDPTPVLRGESKSRPKARRFDRETNLTMTDIQWQRLISKAVDFTRRLANEIDKDLREDENRRMVRGVTFEIAANRLSVYFKDGFEVSIRRNESGRLLLIPGFKTKKEDWDVLKKGIEKVLTPYTYDIDPEYVDFSGQMHKIPTQGYLVDTGEPITINSKGTGGIVSLKNLSTNVRKFAQFDRDLQTGLVTNIRFIGEESKGLVQAGQNKDTGELNNWREVDMTKPTDIETKSVPASDLAKSIEFGTAGWRAGHLLLGQEGIVPDKIDTSVTIDNVGRTAQAIANVLQKKGGRQRVAVGYDVRTMGPEFARHVVSVLTANGIAADLINQVNPSPVIAEATRQGQPYTLGIAITASHNEVFTHLGPDVIWSGMKVFENGFPGGDELTGAIALEAKDTSKNGSYQFLAFEKIPQWLTRRGVDLLARSNRRLDIAFNFAELRPKLASFLEKIPEFSLLIDSMHGATLKAAAILLTLGVPGIHLRTEPVSAGLHPRNTEWSPNPTNAKFYPEFLDQFKKDQLGLLFDGDGDRAVVKDIDGKTEITPNMLGVIFAHYLYTKKGVRGKIVRTLPTSRMLDLLARNLNVELVETPVGSKNFAPYGDDILVAVEESGHIFFKLNGELFVDSAVAEGVLALDILANTGKSLRQYYVDVASELGGFVYNRGSVDKKLIDEPFKEHLLALRRDRPEVFAQELAKALGKDLRKDSHGQVADKVSYNTVDSTGILVLFADDMWAMYRLSGTDGSVRIYGEEKNAEKLAAQEKAVQNVLVKLKPVSFSVIEELKFENNASLIIQNEKQSNYKELVAQRLDVLARRISERLGRKLLLKRSTDKTSGKTKEEEILGVSYESSKDETKALVRFVDGSWIFLHKGRVSKNKVAVISSDDNAGTVSVVRAVLENFMKPLPYPSIDNARPTQDVLPEMLANAAALIGVTVKDLQASRKLADEAADVYNATVGGLFKIINGRNIKEVSPTPVKIPSTVSTDVKARHLQRAKAGELGYLIFGAGRATRMKLPHEFDDLGIAGIVEWFLIQFQKYKPGGEYGDVSENMGYFDLAIRNAKAGIINKTDIELALKDLTMVQRQLLQLWYDTTKLAEANPEADVSAEEAIKGLSFTVVVNHSNREAVQKQLAALHFPGKIKVMEQPEVGGYVINEDGSLTWKDEAVFPEGHGQPFIAMSQTTGHVYELNNETGQWVEVNSTLVDALGKENVKYFMFSQVNDLHLLGNMASVERWTTALGEIDDGAEFVMEMVENTLKQKGGGTFLNANGFAEMRDTLAMKRPQLDAVTVPQSLSRMFYFGRLEALRKINWNSIPAYLNIREVNGKVLFTRELYSGDASSALKSRTMEQSGLAINTFKDRGRANVAQDAYHQQNAQPRFQEWMKRILQISGGLILAAIVSSGVGVSQNEIAQHLPALETVVGQSSHLVQNIIQTHPGINAGGILAAAGLLGAIGFTGAVILMLLLGLLSKMFEKDTSGHPNKPLREPNESQPHVQDANYVDQAYAISQQYSSARTDDMVTALMELAPNGAIIGSDRKVISETIIGASGLIHSDNEDTRKRAMDWSIRYLNQVRMHRAMPQFITAEARSLDDNFRRPGVTVLHIGQKADSVQSDIDNLSAITKFYTQSPQPEGETHRAPEIIVIVHPAAASKREEISALLSGYKNSAQLNLVDLQKKGAIWTYNDVLSAALQANPNLEIVNRLIYDENISDILFRTFDRLPGQFISEGKLRDIWTLILNLSSAGWAIVPLDEVIGGARLAAEAA